MISVLICSDRDGTINKDENYYLGASKNWKEQISFLPGLVEGIKLLNKIPDSKFVILTNQSGVALADKEFIELTEERLEEVNQEIVSRLKKEGAIVDAYYSCPFVDHKYVEKSVKKGRTIHALYIHDNHPDMKPNTGLIKKAAEKYGTKIPDIKYKFMLGDRYSDIEMGVKAGCVSILIRSYKTDELRDLDKTLALQKEHPKQVIITKDFLEAANIISSIVIN